MFVLFFFFVCVWGGGGGVIVFFFVFVFSFFSFLINFFKQIFQKYHIRVSTSLDTDQAQNFVGPDLGPNCLQRLSGYNKSHHYLGGDFNPKHAKQNCITQILIFFNYF